LVGSAGVAGNREEAVSPSAGEARRDETRKEEEEKRKRGISDQKQNAPDSI